MVDGDLVFLCLDQEVAQVGVRQGTYGVLDDPLARSAAFPSPGPLPGGEEVIHTLPLPGEGKTTGSPGEGIRRGRGFEDAAAEGP